MFNCSPHDVDSYFKLSQMTNKQLKAYAEIHISTDSADLIQVLIERIPNEQIPNKKKFERVINYPILNGISSCMNCESKDCCQMNALIDTWNEVKEQTYPQAVSDINFKQYNIDTPEVENGVVTWCPMYDKE